MYSVFSSSSINKLFYQVLDASVDWPKGVQRREGTTTIDSPGPVCCHLTRPRNRVLTIPGRGASYPATCAETLWVLAGRNDIEFLSTFLPRAFSFSDDGKTWRAGYGPRLRGVHNGFCDQLNCSIKELTKDSNSRRAVIGLLDTYDDYGALLQNPKGTKDFPCTQSLSFMVRDGRLDLTVFMRSNDFIWGWSGVNVFEFTVLQEVVSSCTGIPLGEFYIISNSLHIYEPMNIRLNTIMSKERFDIYDYVSPSRMERTDLPSFDEDVRDCLAFLEGKYRTEWVLQCWLRSNIVGDLGLVSWLSQASGNPALVLEAIDSIMDTPSRVAILEWLCRRLGDNPNPYLDYISSFSVPIKRYILGDKYKEVEDGARNDGNNGVNGGS